MKKTDRVILKACSLSELLRKLAEFQTKHPNVKPAEVIVLMLVETLALEFQRDLTPEEVEESRQKTLAAKALRLKLDELVSSIPDTRLPEVFGLLKSLY